MSRKPIIGVTACIKTVDNGPVQSVGAKYIHGVTHGAEGTPLLIPALGEALDLDAILDLVDGVFVTGSLSNVEPSHYGGEPSAPGTLHDPARDATTLPLIRKAVARGIPLIGICRGHQELNVAYGGTLYQRVHEQPGRIDHRAPVSDDVDVKFALAHGITLAPGGLLEQLCRSAGVATGGLQVNSLHWQAIDRLGDGLVVEATAPDGTIEAVRVADAPAFALGVQFHPEHRVTEVPLYRAILGAFGAAARAYADQRRGGAGRTRAA